VGRSSSSSSDWIARRLLVWELVCREVREEAGVYAQRSFANTSDQGVFRKFRSGPSSMDSKRYYQITSWVSVLTTVLIGSQRSIIRVRLVRLYNAIPLPFG
jgi:hypothetical protein